MISIVASLFLTIIINVVFEIVYAEMSIVQSLLMCCIIY